MNLPSPDHGTDRRPRSLTHALATGASALAVAAVAAGAASGAAVASPGTAHAAGHARLARAVHAQTTDTSSRILELDGTSNDPHETTMQRLSYTDPTSGVNYLLDTEYAGSSLYYQTWQSSTPQSDGSSALDVVDIDPGHQLYDEVTSTQPKAKDTIVGIESTGAEVKQAVAQGKVKKLGMVTIGGQRLLSLALPSDSKAQKLQDLYVDPTSDAPVAEKQIVVDAKDNYTFTFHYSFQDATPSQISNLETKPAVPSGYTQSSTSLK